MSATQQDQGTTADAVLWRWALQYATGGTPIFPCCPADGAFLNYRGEPIKAKAPLTTHGFKDATTDSNQIAKWWGRDYRFAMIGRMVPLVWCVSTSTRGKAANSPT